MFRILIVDDEPWQVKTLANIVKTMKPDCEVFEASDGKEALNFITCNKINVIITDIRMPIMDGLEMIEKITACADRPEIVILSGYGEFQYAQKAINFGVFEYLVKPLSKTDIEGILQRLEKKFKQRELELEQKKGIYKKLENTLPVYIEHQLNQWINNALNGAEIEELLEIFPKRGNVSLLVSNIGKYKRIAEMYNSEEFKKLLLHLKFSMKEALNPLGHSISFFSEENQGSMITILTSEKGFNLCSDKNQKIIKDFINRIKNEFGIRLRIGIGNSHTSIVRDLRKCYDEAVHALEYGFIDGEREIIHFSDIQISDQKDSLDIYSLEEELNRVALKAAYGMTAIAVNDIFERYVGKLSFIGSKKIKEFLYYAAMNIVKMIKNMLMDEHYGILVENIRNGIFESDSYTELKYTFIDILESIAKYINNNENKNNYLVVLKCKEYIDENYMVDLSLESAASKFHFSPSYFCNIFKNYAGISFSEYLTAVRIQKAQHFLKNTKLKVYDISEKVGYKDSTYFNRIFKREVGISPYKFRQISACL